MKSKKQTDFIEEIFFQAMKNQKFLIACSGGADSMALLHYCAQNFTSQTICAHFNHAWSASSDNAEELVKQFCEKSKIQFYSGKAKTKGPTSEDKAREQRYKFLEKLAEKNKVKYILTAHHQDDQVETFFLRLLRGSGFKGLSCIASSRRLNDEANGKSGILLLRPLLASSKENLEQYCKKNKIKFYEDPSNKNLEIKRNLLRQEVLPKLGSLNPEYQRQIINFVEQCRWAEEFTQTILKRLSKRNFSCRKDFLKLDSFVQNAVIKKILQDNSITPSHELIRRLITKIESEIKTKISLGRNVFFICDPQLNSFGLQKTNTKLLALTSRKFLSGRSLVFGATCRVLVEPKKASLKNISMTRASKKVFLDLSGFELADLVFRTAKPGDLFKPLNQDAPKDLKKYLYKRSSLDKKRLITKTPLLACENQILWIPGVEISDFVKVSSKATHVLEFEEF